MQKKVREELDKAGCEPPYDLRDVVDATYKALKEQDGKGVIGIGKDDNIEEPVKGFTVRWAQCNSTQKAQS